MAKRAASSSPRPRPTSAPTPTAARPATTGSTTNTPDEDAIRRRAYEIYVGRGANGGSPVEDWLQAERELLSGRRRIAVTSN